MKCLCYAVFALLFLFSFPTFAEERECSSEVTAPCTLPRDEVKNEILNMVFDNKAGYKLVTENRNHLAFLIEDREEEDLPRVTLIRGYEEGSPDGILVVKKYEVLLMDCRGGDECGDQYLWTVIETQRGTEWHFRTEYRNTIVKYRR